MRLAAISALFLLTGGAAPVEAQQAPAPIPIEEWSLEKVSAMGAEIYRHDVAARVATDALIAHLAGSPLPPGTAGWIVVDEGGVQRVRFVKQVDGKLSSAFDVQVQGGRAGEVKPGDIPLSDVETAAFRARQTAVSNIGRLVCTRNLNTVVLDDPESDGWLVWLLSSTADADIVPLGGHYRFRISADGSTVLRRDMLSNSCLSGPRQQTDEQGAPLNMMVTQVVSQGPVETHVFLSLQYRIPIQVMTSEGRLFWVNGARVSEVY